MLRKTWKIVRRILLTLGLTIYILVALVNFSVVQSYLGALAGSYFSKEWGGKVSIGSLHAMPWDHLIADNLLWISPTGDTLLVADQLKVTFDRFPFDGDGLEFSRVYLKNAYYHFAIENHKTNLQFVIDYFKSDKKSKKHAPFTVKAKELVLDNVHYRMDLPDNRKTKYAHGVQIPHMEFFDIKAKFKDVLVVNDDVRCKIVSFSTREKSGFVLDELRGDIHVNREEIVAKNMAVVTPHSQIYLDTKLSYDGWAGMKGYVSTVHHEAEFKPGTQVSMNDVAYWAPVLWGIDATVEAEGTASGTIDSLTTDMKILWGKESSAQLAGTVTGLPKIEKTVFDLDVEHLITNRNDLHILLDRMALEGSASKIIEAVDHVDLIASVQGCLEGNMATNILADCGLGRVRIDAMLRRAPEGYDLSFDAQSDRMDLTILENEWITHTGFDLSIDGAWNGDLHDMKNWPQRLALGIDGHLTNSVVKGHRLTTTYLSGQLKKGRLVAKLESSDTLADINATVEANLTGEEKQYNADITVGNLDIGLLPYPFATHLTTSISGKTLNDLEGQLTATDIRYGALTLDKIEMNVESDASGKEVFFTSDFADATVKGRFNYEDLPVIFTHFGYQYFPSLFNNFDETDSSWVEKLRDDVFSYRVMWKDSGRILNSLIKNVSIAQGTVIDGSYNFREQMKMVLISDSLRFGSVLVTDVGLSGRPWGSRYELKADAQNITIGKMNLLEHVTVKVNSNREVSSFGLKWGNNEMATQGDLQLELVGDSLSVTKPYFYVGKTLWKLSSEDITLRKSDDGKLQLNGEKLQLESHGQSINARLQLNGRVTDCVELDFDHFNLNLLCEMLLQNSPVSIDGDINGHFSLFGLQSTPYFVSDLVIDSCMVNNQHLGEVKVNSHWNSELNNLNLNLRSKQILAYGWLGLGGTSPELNFKAEFNSFELAMVQPLLSTVSSHIGGQLHGNVDISGKISHPQFVGLAIVERGEMKIDLTDVTYHFADSILFNNNTITLKDFDILDPLNNKATANGTINISNEWKILLDVGLTTNNFMLLNKKSGDQFYGKLFASVDGKATGYIDNFNINVRARTNPGCDITVPISTQQHVKSQNYITFVSDKPAGDEQVATKKSRKTNYNLELDLNITPDAKINLPMNFNDVGLTVGSAGAGDLHLKLNSTNGAQMMGSYEITSGTMKVGFLSVYEKRFSIEQGSSLNFQGSVPDARFDMKAVYSQRANLSTLTGSLSSVDNTQKYIQVENVIAISGTVRDPHISFDLRLPNADQSVEEEVFAYIDRSSERDMMNQTVSLLISGSFYNVNNESQASSNPLNIVTSFVGNSLTDMVQFVDVNIDYRAATDQTNQQVDVNISKDWGRWYLESTLGYGGESRELDAKTVNGAIIDALIGYRLSPMVHLYAYNRTNTNDYTRIDLPYKQGAGLKLTKDFDNWGDLFKRKKKKK